MPSLSQAIAHSAVKLALAVTQGPAHRALTRASRMPREAQSALLKQILATNSETDFGKRHGFSRINSMDDYRRAVPIQTYEDLRPYIERQERSAEPCLTREQPVFYHRTSGTVGVPKDIPVTETGLARIKKHQKTFAYTVSRCTDALQGKLFGITGQAVEGTMPGGTPFGSASGLLYHSQSRFVRAKHVLPPEISDITDYQTRYLATAAYGLTEPGVTCVATANPSTLVRLLSLINEQPDTVLRAVSDGHLPQAVAPCENLNTRLAPNPNRARSLSRVVESAGRLTYTDIWPHLKAVTTWTGGSCGVPLRSLSDSFPRDTRIIELGYLASEVQGTTNIDAQQNICLPTLLDTVFEFVARDQWETGTADFLCLHQLETGRDYYVFVTTPEGLYRYHMNDIVRVTGRVNETPTLAFVQKGKGVTSITGEKLYEAQVLDAVMAALADLSVHANFFIMLADQDAARYTLYLEAGCENTGIAADLAAAIDARLRAVNIEYDNKRGSGRLAPLALRWLRDGAGDAYRASRVAAGQRDAQFKYLHLQYAHECPFDFDAFAAAG